MRAGGKGPLTPTQTNCLEFRVEGVIRVSGLGESLPRGRIRYFHFLDHL